MFRQDITVYNQVFNPTTKFDEYKATHLKAHWESEVGVNLGGITVTHDSKFVVVIPHDTKGYVPEEDYQGEGWTLRDGDFIMKGLGTEIESFDDIKTSQKMVIESIEEVDYSLSGILNNFTVRGK